MLFLLPIVLTILYFKLNYIILLLQSFIKYLIQAPVFMFSCEIAHYRKILISVYQNILLVLTKLLFREMD